MVTKAQKFRLGIFIVVTSIIMVVFIVLVAGTKLMQKRDTYLIIYENTSINGLQVGGAVKYYGLNIGRVEDIVIDKEDINKVVVTISVKEDTPLKKDVEATLVYVGITGLKQIEIFGGTNESPLLKPGGYITAGKSAMDSITGRAEILTAKIETIIDNIIQLTDQENQVKLENILTNVDGIITENRDSFQGTMNNLDSLTEELTTLVSETSTAMSKLNLILNNAEIITKDLSESDLKQLVKNANSAIKKANTTFSLINSTVDNSQDDIADTIQLLKETMEYLNEFSRQINENPSLLIRSGK